VAENKSQITVCPFENDATTLMYYSREQELKSFLAVPIFSSVRELIGVLACDSKKSYAFPKLAEKVLTDFAQIAGQFLELQSAGSADRTVSKSLLDQVLETLRSQEDERALLSAASDLPLELIEREALVVLCLADGGTGESAFYSKSLENTANNRLLELVCRHKKLISRERSVQSVNGDDFGRSFLSVPFRVLGHEAGALNLLSRPNESFSLDQIAALEKVAVVVGHELERNRLASLFSRQSSINDWKSFELRANAGLKQGPHALLRFILGNLAEIELNFGQTTAISLVSRFSRLLEQVRGAEGLLCALNGNHFLLLCPAPEKDRILRRVETILTKPNPLMEGIPEEAIAQFSSGLCISGALSGNTGSNEIGILCRKTLSVLNSTPLSEQVARKAAQVERKAEKDTDWKL
jgi:transcriptional regulator with GAF, ATPase, and Fis domain